jgi:heat shock protein HslJ
MICSGDVMSQENNIHMAEVNEIADEGRNKCNHYHSEVTQCSGRCKFYEGHPTDHYCDSCSSYWSNKG